MRRHVPSPRKTNCSTAASRNRRPVIEHLENRRLLAGDPLLFIENFSDDYNPALPGFDQADNDPNTPPDRLLIQHQISARGASIQPVGLVRPESTFFPSSPHVLSILGPGTDRIQL